MKLVLSLILLVGAGSPCALAAMVGSASAAHSGSNKADAVMLAADPASSQTSQPVAPDGEATVYLLGNYSKLFDLIYTIRLTQQPRNESWSTLGVMLIGTENPGPSIQVGLAQENATTIKVFTTIGSASGADEYNGYALACVPDCEFELHGDDDNITAFVSGQVVGKWPRTGVLLKNPYVQINGEVHGAHDAIDGSVTLKRASLGSMEAKPAVCGYTRGGIVAMALRDDTLAFSGTRDDGASAFYYSVVDGHKGTDCNEITATSLPPR